MKVADICKDMWRNCPFEPGKQYQVIKDIDFLNHHFKKGAIVVFKDCAYDFHQGVTRYWFSDRDGSDTNVWHVFDKDPDPSETWKDLFKPE